MPTHIPDHDLAVFIQEINRYCTRFGLDVISPCSDQVATACSLCKDTLKLQVPLPGYKAFAKTIDRKAAVDLARENSLPASPEAFEWQDLEQASSIGVSQPASKTLQFFCYHRDQKESL